MSIHGRLSILVYKTALIIFLGLGSINAFGQGYSLSSTSGTFEALTDAIALDDLEQDDYLTGDVNVGFDFNYFGNSYSALRVSSNGVMIFGLDPSSNPTLGENVISRSPYLKIIAPLWDDLSGVGGSASYKVVGDSPNRVFIMEWLNWKWNYNASMANISFQVKLYEGTNVIEFSYREEAGALNGADASIGLIGNQMKSFYALSNASADPTFTFNGNNLINTKPLSGQLYSFTPFQINTPTVQAINIETTVEAESLSATCTKGGGQYRAVFVKQTSSISEVFLPLDGNYYAPSQTFGNAPAGSGWFCVYNGQSNNFEIENLESGLPYKVHVVEYNGIAGTQRYLNNTAETNPVVVNTPLVTPSGNYSVITLLSTSATKVTFDLNEGNGYKRAIFIKEQLDEETIKAALPVDDSIYISDEIFMGGTQIDTSGWYCIFNGISASTITITGLSGSKSYLMHVVDYNGIPGSEKYYKVPENITQFSTSYDIMLPEYTFSKVVNTFDPIENGIALDAIEKDDALSDAMDLGFNFWLGGVSFTKFRASSNGFITFNEYALDAEGHSSANLNNLKNSLLRPLIAPLWDDLDGSSGQASYTTVGETPERIFIMEYLYWKWTYTAIAPVISFQIRLHEKNNTIEFSYRREDGALLDAGASTGVAFHDLGAGNFLSLNNFSSVNSISKSIESTGINTKPLTGQRYIFTPIKFDQEILFDAIDPKTYGDESFKINADVASGLLLRYTSSDESTATIKDDSITIEGAGSSTITAYQDGDANYNAAPPVSMVFFVNKAEQIITFDTLATRTFGDPSFPLHAQTDSGLPVHFSSGDNLFAEVVNDSIRIKGAGSVNVTAQQDGDRNYKAAEAVIQPLIIHKATQAISFVVSDKTIDDESFILEGKSDSSLPLTFSTVSKEITITDTLVSLITPGTVTIVAIQSGNENFEPASLSQTFCVNPKKPTLVIVTGELNPFLVSSSDTANIWFEDDNLIEGLSSPSLFPETSGNYSVQVVIDGCSSNRSDATYILITTVTDAETRDRVAVYPNPVKNLLTVDFSQDVTEGGEVILFDALGRRLITEFINQNVQLDFTTFKPGFYLLTIKKGNTIMHWSLLKQ